MKTALWIAFGMFALCLRLVFWLPIATIELWEGRIVSEARLAFAVGLSLTWALLAGILLSSVFFEIAEFAMYPSLPFMIAVVIYGVMGMLAFLGFAWNLDMRDAQNKKAV